MERKEHLALCSVSVAECAARQDVAGFSACKIWFWGNLWVRCALWVF